MRAYRKYIPETHGILCIDLHIGGLSFHDVYYLQGEEIVKRRHKEGGVFVLSPEDRMMVILLRGLLVKGAIKTDHRLEWEDLYAKGSYEPETLRQSLSAVIGEKLTEEVRSRATRKKFDELLMLRRQALARFFLYSPRRMAKAIHQVITGRLAELGKRSRMRFFALIGPDGAGKSTLTARVKEYLNDHNMQAEVVYMGKAQQRILPGITETAERVGLNLIGVDEIARQTAWKRSLYRVGRDAVYLMDLLLRYWCRILPKLWKGYYVLTDRYPYDLFLDTNTTTLTKQVLLRIFPRPSVIFYLYNDPSVLDSRKPQYGVVEIARQMSVYRALEPQLRVTNFVPIRTDIFSDSFDKIIRCIVATTEYTA
jgi:thymidylate kinase